MKGFNNEEVLVALADYNMCVIRKQICNDFAQCRHRDCINPPTPHVYFV